MILSAELVAAFVAGICFTVVAVALLGPRFVRWYMKRKLGGMLSFDPTIQMRSKPVYSTRPIRHSDLPPVMGEYVTPPKP